MRKKTTPRPSYKKRDNDLMDAFCENFLVKIFATALVKPGSTARPTIIEALEAQGCDDKLCLELIKGAMNGELSYVNQLKYALGMAFKEASA